VCQKCTIGPHNTTHTSTPPLSCLQAVCSSCCPVPNQHFQSTEVLTLNYERNTSWMLCLLFLFYSDIICRNWLHMQQHSGLTVSELMCGQQWLISGRQNVSVVGDTDGQNHCQHIVTNNTVINRLSQDVRRQLPETANNNCAIY